MDEALQRLGRARQRALDECRYTVLVEILTRIGRILLEQEKFDEAAATLHEAPWPQRWAGPRR